MTNKLPEIGARYKSKHYTAKVTSIIPYWFNSITMEKETSTDRIVHVSPEFFKHNFEPLPKEQEDLINESISIMNGSHKDNLEQDHISRKGKKVLEAKEELKIYLEDYSYSNLSNASADRFFRLSQNLINALDPIKEDKTDTKEESAAAMDIRENKRCLNCNIELTQCAEQHIDNKIYCGGACYFEEMSKKDDNLPMKEETKSIWKDVSEFDELNALIHEQGFSVELMIYLQFILNQQEQNTKDIAELKQLIKGE